MIFSNLNFPDTKKLGVQLVLEIQSRPWCPDSKMIRHDQRLEWKVTVKNGEVSHSEVSSNNAKSHFPGQHGRKFPAWEYINLS